MIQVWLVWVPNKERLNRNLLIHQPALHRKACANRRDVPRRSNLNLDHVILFRISAINNEMLHAGIEIGRQLKSLNMGFAAGLDEDRLPDAAVRGVPAPL